MRISPTFDREVGNGGKGNSFPANVDDFRRYRSQQRPVPRLRPGRTVKQLGASPIASGDDGAATGTEIGTPTISTEPGSGRQGAHSARGGLKDLFWLFAALFFSTMIAGYAMSAHLIG